MREYQAFWPVYQAFWPVYQAFWPVYQAFWPELGRPVRARPDSGFCASCGCAGQGCAGQGSESGSGGPRLPAEPSAPVLIGS
jgi:hypothetical protein